MLIKSDYTCISLDTIRQCDGRTDRQREMLYQYRVSVLARDENEERRRLKWLWHIDLTKTESAKWAVDNGF